MFKVGFITAKKRDPGCLFQTSGVDLGPLALQSYITSKLSDVDTLITDEIEDLVRFKPDLVGISAASENYPLAIKIAKEVKDRCGSAAIIGGAHITTCPESLNSIFDIGVMGEGEDTLIAVIELYKSGRLEKSDLRGTSGIVFHGRDGLEITESREPIKDLGVLPIPDRRKWVENIGMAYLMTSRGCPYSCYFCAACKVWKGVRFYPVDHVIAEVKDIIDGFKPKAVRFFDDIFTINKDRVKEILSRLIKGGLTKDVYYICWTRADLIDREFVGLLKKANFIHVAFGVESASEGIMRKLKGKGVNLNAVQAGVDMLYEAGINVGLTFIIGTPGETLKDLDKTYAFIGKNAEKIFDVEINPLIVFPSTPLWTYAEKKGLVSKDIDWERLGDTGVILNFDFRKYIYLNNALSKGMFLEYVEKFKDLYKRICLRPRNFDFMNKTFPLSVFPSRLKRFS